MPEYRKRMTSDTWHWFPNCTNWPTYAYVSKDKKPKKGDLCNQCRAKQKKADAA